jgi:hypothetical protein
MVIESGAPGPASMNPGGTSTFRARARTVSANAALRNVPFNFAIPTTRTAIVEKTGHVVGLFRFRIHALKGCKRMTASGA